METNRITAELVSGKAHYFSTDYTYSFIQVSIVVVDTLEHKQRFTFSINNGIEKLVYVFTDSSRIADILLVIGATGKDGRYSHCSLEELRTYLQLTYHRYSSSYNVHISKMEVL